MKKIFQKKWRSTRSPWQVFQNIAAVQETAFFLDSPGKSENEKYSYLGYDPFLRIELSLPDNVLYVRSESQIKKYPAQKAAQVLRRALRDCGRMAKSKGPYFSGGAVGYLGYEAAQLFEDVKIVRKPRLGEPDMFFGFYANVIVYDHQKREYILIVRGNNVAEAERKFEKIAVYFQMPSSPSMPFHLEKFKPVLKRKQFENKVKRAKKYIEAGDIYQANLSQQFDFKFSGSPIKLYDALRKINPSPFSSYLKIRDLSIVSSSPERLIRKKGMVCETKPIAGTRPRKKGGDEKVKRDLLAHPKERAEHIMLVDLERNDLGRVCEFHSVKVNDFMATEKYSHVIHIVSTVTGKLRPKKDGVDLIAAMFPGGTITGCPKIRCMEIIRELEPAARGVYTGSLGYLDFNGDLDLNIIIRTFVIRGQKGILQVGAGVVYDSDPKKEYEETLAKGEALVKALVESGN